MPYPGSVDALTLKVDPYDGTTLATVVLTAPDGTTSTPTAVSSDGGHTWVANPIYTQAGKYVAHWTVTGAGAGVTEQELWVSRPASPASAVAWRPELWHVAAYIPRRTLVGAVSGYGEALETFTADTHPSAQAVNRLVSDACAWVGLLVTPVATPLLDQARAAAAVRAAAMVELTYPDNRDDLSTADTLLKLADAMRADLDTANVAVVGADPEDPKTLLPVLYGFPDAPLWGDELL